MAKVLTINNKLTRLYLNVRFVFFKHQSLIKTIQHSQNNFIGDKGVKNITKALKTNNTLTTLNLAVRFVILNNQLEILIQFSSFVQHS